MPETQSNQDNNSVPKPLTQKPQIVGVITLCLLGLAAFAFVFTYLGAHLPAKSQAAAAVASTSPFDSLAIEAKSAIVVDLVNGKVLYERNADAQLPLASLTKVPLVLTVADVLSPDTVITIPHDTSPKGSAERLAKGDRWRVGDVITFTLVASSNAGAEILADAANDAIHMKYPESPETGATLWRMNALAHELGLSHTYFLNVSGLDESTTQAGSYGSARDIERLFAYAASTTPDTFAGTAKDGLLLTAENGNTTSAFNTNHALGKIPGLIMGKTGLTDLAGGNLAVVFDIGLAHPVVAVVMGSSQEGRFSDMQNLVTVARKAITQE